MSVVMGYTLFMLHHALPTRHVVGCMVDGSVDPSWSDQLQQQAAIMAKAARAMATNHHYNQQQLLKKANAGTIKVGD